MHQKVILTDNKTNLYFFEKLISMENLCLLHITKYKYIKDFFANLNFRLKKKILFLTINTPRNIRSNLKTINLF